jgi:hypothetical protein
VKRFASGSVSISFSLASPTEALAKVGATVVDDVKVQRGRPPS